LSGDWVGTDGRRWRLRAADEGQILAAGRSFGVRPVAARVLAARAVTPAFLAAGVESFADGRAMLGLDRAVERLERAVAGGEPIRLVTDYDVDGTTSCLILHAALDRLGAPRVDYHIPDRFTEGYGLSLRAVESAANAGVRVVVTADIGVRDHASVSRARELGLDVIVCDHHLPAGESVPRDALAVICPPQEGCAYPNKALAACGVSFKLASALLERDPQREAVLGSMLKLAAIGTVADIVDLGTPENRAIVALGLRALNAGRHAPGLQALLDVAGCRAGEIDTGSLGYRVGPRINAAGRLQDAAMVVRLLRERDPARARSMAADLDRLNAERREVQARLLERAMERLPSPVPAFVLVHGDEAEEGFHRGVVGIVASKVRERVDRPVAVVSRQGAVSTGSVRSTPGVHAVRALDAASQLLLRYGGHAAAAGFTVRTADLDDLAAILAGWAERNGGAPEPEPVDADVPAGAVDTALVQELARLEPCGKGNEAARVRVGGPIRDVRPFGNDHLRFSVGGVGATWWGEAGRAARVAGAAAVVGRLELDRWGGRERARLAVEDAVG
jgi:single-stranded-DNA-specific exonuclease